MMLLHPERHHLRRQIETPYPRNTNTQSIFRRYGKDRPSLERQNERVMIERVEKEDIETQIYKDILIMSDDDGKMRERRSLNPNLQRYIDTPQPHYMNWRENTPRKRPRISLLQPYSSSFL